MANVEIPEDRDGRERFWRRVIARWESSGLESMAEFCRREGVPATRFYRWRRRFARHDGCRGDLGFLPVTAAPAVTTQPSHPVPGNTIRLEIGDRLGITLHEGFDPELLRSVVAALT